MDFKTVARAVWPPFGTWLMMVIAVATGGHQPGVICVTPMAWLLALWVGLRSAAFTRSQRRSTRLAESAVAGALLGLLQGGLFIAFAPMMGPIKQEETQKMIVLDTVMVGLGAAVSSVLSLAIAASQEKRRTSQ